MRYVKARLEQYRGELSYRIYVTDTLYYGNRQLALESRYIDLINKKVDNRSADEIVADIIKKAGLEVEQL